MANLNQVELEELKDQYRELMRQYGGTNLAGQQTPDGTYGYYTPDFSYGSYKIPYQDPTYSSGYEYARTIAGGMPFEDVVAPGMSFSPDQPMGYTQADLRRKEIYGDFDGVMPVAPTKGTPVEASYETMEYAPVGTPAPEPYVPGQTPFPGIPDFLKDLDFSNLPGVQEPSEPQFGSSAPAGFIPPPPGSFNTMAFVDYYNPTTGETWSAPSGGWTAPEGWVIGRPDGGLKFTFDESTSNSSEPSPKEDFFKVDQNLFNFEEIADKIDMDKVAKIDIEKIDIPESVSLFSDILNEPVSTEPVIPKPVLPSIFEPAVPEMPTKPIQTLPQNIFANIPKPQPMPVIPNIPNIPKLPIVPQPVMPQPIMPTSTPRVSTPLIPSFVQPNIEEIVRPIAVGKQGLPQYGLFNLV
jgi:hypothetical protein